MYAILGLWFVALFLCLHCVITSVGEERAAGHSASHVAYVQIVDVPLRSLFLSASIVDGVTSQA